MIAQRGVGGCGLGVAPGGVWARGSGRVKGGVDVEGPVGGGAFELAEAAAAGRADEEFEGDIGGRNVEDGRVAGFEDAEGVGGVGDEDAAVEDANVTGGGFEARGARVVPYRFDGRIVWRGQSGAFRRGAGDAVAP